MSFIEEKSIVPEEAPLPEHPEVVVFASYSGPPKYPVRVSVLSEMVIVCTFMCVRVREREWRVHACIHVCVDEWMPYTLMHCQS